MENREQFLTRVGNNIRAARKAAGLTQQQTADLVHIHRSALSYIECGYNAPILTTFKRIADVVGVDVKSLL